MKNPNSQYNQDVAEIFVALANATKSDPAEMGQSEVNGLATIARALTANTPQVY
ncbi:MAG: hypothetical protein V3U75_11580 [Methylococcaceae bacterium]